MRYSKTKRMFSDWFSYFYSWKVSLFTWPTVIFAVLKYTWKLPVLASILWMCSRWNVFSNSNGQTREVGTYRISLEYVLPKRTRRNWNEGKLKLGALSFTCARLTRVPELRHYRTRTYSYLSVLMLCCVHLFYIIRCPIIINSAQTWSGINILVDDALPDCHFW